MNRKTRMVTEAVPVRDHPVRDKQWGPGHGRGWRIPGRFQVRACAFGSGRKDGWESKPMKCISPAVLWKYLPATLLILGCVGLLTEASPSWLWWLLVWGGWVLHYVQCLRDGVMRTGFLICRPRWTIHQSDSPSLFLFAAVVEGLFGFGLILALLVSL